MGIKICADWFLAREHRVKVFVPSDRCQLAKPSIIDYLIDHDALVRTPTGCNDDLFVIEAAKQSNAIIVSNDLYRDESRFDLEAQCFIQSHRLPYIFVDDLFIPAKDPLGKTGPSLDKFLTVAYQDSFHSKLSRTKSHQRYNQRAPTRQFHHRSIQATRSLPIQPPINPSGKPNNLSFNHAKNDACINELEPDINNRSEQSDPCQTDPVMRRSLKKSVSVVYMQNEGCQAVSQARGKQALCRTKSHNI